MEEEEAMTPAEQQAWNDHMGELFSIPSYEVIERFGKKWMRNHPLRCPMCGLTFYSYQAQDTPLPPYENPHRIICGHPLCESAAEREWKQSDQEYKKACRDYYARKAANSGETEPTKGQFALSKSGDS
jgi:hypothetical protein